MLGEHRERLTENSMLIGPVGWLVQSFLFCGQPLLKDTNRKMSRKF